MEPYYRCLWCRKPQGVRPLALCEDCQKEYDQASRDMPGHRPRDDLEDIMATVPYRVARFDQTIHLQDRRNGNTPCGNRSANPSP